ncbi:RNA methyltransferase [Secundilactobacillus kimchicus]|uniref:RsmB/NOP family class I SAM-dependent RNA methyltransferase n=1 Tax=Secundilactobacillus kimchicus TaxID=528209 RepID=UPI001C035B75|nr:RNA methyltransferase [Secundilactobacillus kimchicus]
MNLPKEFIQKYQKLLGDDAKDFLASFEDPATNGFRVNPHHQSLPANLNLTDPVSYSKWGYFGKISGRSVAHQSGAVYSQEPSAMFVGETAAPTASQRVLDLCAAPGGKTTHLSSFLGSTGLLVTNEIMGKRSKVLAENVERFGVANALILNETPEVIASHFPGFFDTVLVDAPCSGEGMFRKDPDGIKYWSPDYVRECAVRQQTILAEAVKTLKPGGTLVYSTCTFAPEEDEQTIAWLLETYPELEVLPIDKPAGIVDGHPEWADGNPELTKTARLFPHLMRGEGHFVAKLRLTSELTAPKKTRLQRGNLTKDQKMLLDSFVADSLQSVDWPSRRLITFGDQLYLLPEATPEFGHLKVVRPGLHLGTFKKGRFEPAYALALALPTDAVRHNVAISITEWAMVVHGDQFKHDALPVKKGWVRLVCDNQPVAFAKVVNGAVKNFFPKGLRFDAHLN